MSDSVNHKFSYIVQPRSAFSLKIFDEIIVFRRLIWMFIWRDILVRYKSTLIGGAWYVLQPLAMMAVFTLFFSNAFKNFMSDIPYSLFAFSGLLIWQMFSRSMSLGSSCLVNYGSILSKIYFPRLIAPLSLIIGTVFDFIVACTMLAVMMVYYHIEPRWTVFLIPLPILVTLIFSAGVSCGLAAIDSRYRDVRHIIPLLIQLWMFCTPVMYPSNYVSGRWQWIYELNPMVGISDWFRWLLFNAGSQPSMSSLWSAVIISLISFVVGLYLFQSAQGTVVDRL